MEEFKADAPLKRVEALQYLSHDHHHNLLLCWKIRKGLANNIAVERIKKYCDWFFKNHIKEHFAIEEKVVFSVLGTTHEGVQRALKEHKELTVLFEVPENSEENLRQIEKHLQEHIRFEERTLFQEVQKQATTAQLQKIKEADDLEKFKENEEDAFWL